jgi:putative hydrolase of the HAD superfamily
MKKIENIKAVIFDLDNTLCDTITAIHKSMRVCYKYLKNYYEEITFEQFIEVEEKIFYYLTLEKKLPVYSFRALYWHEIFNALNLPHNPVYIKNLIQLYSDQIAKNVELFEGIEETLVELKNRNKRLAILSNGDFQTKASMIEYLNISKYFDLVVASDLTQADKPNPKAFEYTLELLKLGKEEVVMVGDERVNDVEGALDYGIKSFYVLWPEKNKGKTLGLKNAKCLYTPQDLLDYI